MDNSSNISDNNSSSNNNNGNSHRSHNPHLALNKISRSIRKIPFNHHHHHHHHQRSSAAQPTPPLQPQVYNISKNDFRSIVQQLTGTTPNPNPNPNPNPSFRPYPPRPPHPKPPSQRLQKIRPPPLAPIARPPPPNPSFHAPMRPGPAPPVADSPVSMYMRYLEGSIVNLDGSRQQQQPPLLPSPATGGLLPSPVLSPSAFLNLASPRSPYPLLSPSFMPSPLAGSGILGPGPGPGPGPQMPPSPGLLFPPSPSGFLPFLSPRWRDM